MLLDFLLADEHRARGAWQEWTSNNRFEDIDSVSYLLVPQLTRRLKQLALQYPAMKKLEGIHKSHWYSNNLLLLGLADVVEHFRSRGIESLVIKGISAGRYYREDIGIRPMVDTDILIRPVDLPAALEILADTGWRTDPAYSDSMIRNTLRYRDKACSFRKGNVGIDLHWYATHIDFSRGTHEELWSNRVPISVQSFNFTVPSDIGLLYLLCLHAMRFEANVRILWITDIVHLMWTAGNNLDWDRLADIGRRAYTDHIVHAALAGLAERYGNLPEGCHRAPRSTRLTRRIRDWELNGILSSPVARQHRSRLAAFLLNLRRNWQRDDPDWQGMGKWRYVSRRGIRVAERIARRIVPWKARRVIFRSLLPKPGINTALHRKVPALDLCRPVTFSNTGSGYQWLLEGWSSSEEAWTWGVENRMKMIIRALESQPYPRLIAFAADVYQPRDAQRNTVEISIGWVPSTRWPFAGNTGEFPQRLLLLPRDEIAPASGVDIAFCIDRLHSPVDFERSLDDRPLGLRLHQLMACQTLDISANEVVSFQRGGNGVQYLDDGWSHPELEGTWSVGEVSGLILPLKGKARGNPELEFEWQPYRGRAYRIDAISVKINNGADQSLVPQQEDFQITRLQAGLSKASGQDVLVLRFRIRNTHIRHLRPEDGETRQLGFRLRRITLIETTDVQ